jgi:hypothetical protein
MLITSLSSSLSVLAGALYTHVTKHTLMNSRSANYPPQLDSLVLEETIHK